MTTTMKAGDYYVGDPCYALDQEAYDAFLAQCIDGNDCLQGAFVLPGGHRICVFSTMWGDGQYPVTFDFGQSAQLQARDLAVDAGCLSVIPWEAVSQEKLEAGGGIDHLGLRVYYPASFVCESECNREDKLRLGRQLSGILRFGHVVVDTDPRDDEDEED